MKTKNLALTLLKHGGNQSKVLDIIINQTLRQSGLSTVKRHDIVQKLQRFQSNTNIDLPSIAEIMKDSGLEARFNRNIDWLESPSGQEFMKTNLGRMERSVGRYDLAAPAAISFQTVTPKRDILGSNISNMIRSAFPNSKGSVSSNIFASTFNVGGKKQTSYFRNINISVSNRNINIPFYTPSKSGHVSGASLTSRGITGDGAIYITPKTYFINPQVDAAGVLTATKVGSYSQYQEKMIQNLLHRVKEVEDSHMLESEKAVLIEQHRNTYIQEVKKAQFYAGSPATVSGTAGIFGGQNLNKGLQGRNTIQREAAIWSDALSSQKIAPGSLDVYSWITDQGYVAAGSSGQAGARTSLPLTMVQSGSAFEIVPHKEPFKIVSDFAHFGDDKIILTDGSHEVEAFSNRVTNAKVLDIEEQLADGKTKTNPLALKGVRMRATIMPSSSLAQSEAGMFGQGVLPGGSVDLVTPEGITLMNEKMFKSGALTVGEVVPYHITTLGPGGVEGEYVSNVVKTLFEGGELTNAEGEVVKIPGFKRAGSDWTSALGGETAAKKFSGGIPLGRSEFLGINPADGRSVLTPGSKFADSRLMNVSPTGNPGELLLDVARITAGYTVNGRLVAPSLKVVNTDVGLKNQTETINEAQIRGALTEAKVSPAHIERLASTEMLYPGMEHLMESKKINLLQVGAMQKHLDYMLGLSQITEEAKRKAAENLIKSSPDRVLQHLSTSEGRAAYGLPQAAASTPLLVEDAILLASKFVSEGAPQASKDLMVTDIMAPYNAFYKEHGLNPFDITERYFMEPTGIEKRTINPADTIYQEQGVRSKLNTMFNAGMGDVLDARTPMESYINASVRDEGFKLSMGGRFSMEPRTFDIIRANPELHNVGKELTSRMHNFSPEIAEITKTLQGHTPLGQQTDLFAAHKKLGAEAMSVDLSRFNESEINMAMKGMNKELGATFHPTLYVPSSAEVPSMGSILTQSGGERNKSLATIFDDYIGNLREASQLEGNAQSQAVARSTIDFNEKLLAEAQKNLMGQPNAGAAGLFRGDVKGTVLAKNLGYSPELIEVLQGAGDYTSTGLEQKEFDALRQNYQAALASGESVGSQEFLSKSAWQKMRSDLENQYRQARDDAGLQRLEQIEKDLHAQKGVPMPTIRHPTIGSRSITPSRVYLDTASAASGELDYIRSVSEMHPSVSQNGVEFLTSVAQNQNADWDGDGRGVGVMTEEASIRDLEKMLKDPHGHSRRYSQMKNIIKDTLEMQGRSGAYSASVNPMAASQLAIASPNQIVPRISDAFTEIKHIVSKSSMADQLKEEALALLEGAEQSPISNKRIASNVHVAKEYMSKVSHMRSSLFRSAEQAETSIGNFMDFILDSNIVDKYNDDLLPEYVDSARVDKVRIQSTIVGALEEFKQNSSNVDFIQNVRKAGNYQKLSVQQFLNTISHFGEDVSSFHSHGKDIVNAVTNPSSVSGSKLAQQGLTAINTATTKAGLSAAPVSSGTIALAGVVAASMLAATVGAKLVMGGKFESGNRDANLKEDFLFPEDVDEKEKFLHGSPIQTPIVSGLQTNNYNIDIHMPPGNQNVNSLNGSISYALKKAGTNANHAAIKMFDARTKLDSFSISKIKEELI